jgi:hypothetical protein
MTGEVAYRLAVALHKAGILDRVPPRALRAAPHGELARISAADLRCLRTP